MLHVRDEFLYGFILHLLSVGRLFIRVNLSVFDLTKLSIKALQISDQEFIVTVLNPENHRVGKPSPRKRGNHAFNSSGFTFLTMFI